VNGHFYENVRPSRRARSILSKIIRRQFTPVSRAKLAQLDVAKAVAMKREDFIPLAREHPPNLMVTPLGQNDFRCSGAQNTEFGRQAGLLFASKEERTAREERDQVAVERAIDRGLIEFGYFVLWRSQAMHERRAIREEEKAARFFVESTDARDLWIALSPARRKKFVDARSFPRIVRTDSPDGFMKGEKELVRVIEGLAVHAKGCRGSFRSRVIRRFAGNSHATGRDPIPRLAPRAIAQIGQPLVDSS